MKKEDKPHPDGPSVPAPAVVSVQHKAILPSAGNREDGCGMDEKSLRELANSIAERGLIQIPVVRSHPAKKDKYELICGERRWRAVGLLGWEALPVIIRECSDIEAIELRAIENLQREDISELEEARNYKRLLDLKADDNAPVHSIETIAQRIGKSVAFVYSRVKLLKMPDIAQLAMAHGKLSASVALLISRIPDPKLAHKATLEVLTPYGNNTSEEAALDENMEPMSYRRAKDHIAGKYMVRLKGAPFNQEDPDLVPARYETEGVEGGIELPADAVKSTDAVRCFGGKCSDCPFRTGNMKATFPDAESADVCTNPTCFKAKKSAHDRNEAKRFAEKGQKLLTPGKARQILSYDGDGVASSDYIDLRTKPPGKKQTWEEILDGHLPEKVVPEVARGKKNFLVLPREVVAETIKTAKLKVELPKADEGRQSSYREQEAERQEKRAKSEALARFVSDEIKAAVKAEKDVNAFLRLILNQVITRTYLLGVGIDGDDKAMNKHIAELKPDDLRVAIIKSVFSRVVSWQGDLEDEFIYLCQHYGIDLKAARQRMKSAKVAELPLESAEKAN